MTLLRGCGWVRTTNLTRFLGKSNKLHSWKGLRRRDVEDFDELMLLAELDKQGRRRGVNVCTIAEALSYIQSLADQWA